MDKKYLDYLFVPMFIFALLYAVLYKSQRIREDQQQSHPLKEFVIR
jgi:fucose 4-O-acetylase-like acetyltransferase